MRGWIATSFLLLVANVSSTVTEAAELIDVRLLGTTVPRAVPAAIVSGALDSSFEPLRGNRLPAGLRTYWLKIQVAAVIGRYGGEEFIVLLSSADAAAALPIAQRILDRVANVRVEGFGKPIGFTASIGVATSDTLGVWGEHLIARADAGVYLAKGSGRNQVQLAAPTPALQAEPALQRV